MTTEEALSIDRGQPMVNSRSDRAAIRTSAPSLVHEDGSVERRVRLIRPMQRDTLSIEAFASSHWKDAETDEFRAAWERELADIPEFTTSTFHLVTGLLLPIWRRLPDTNARVYRLQSDEGERVIGRVLTAMEADALCRNLGIDAPTLSAGEAWDLLLDGKVTVHLADGLSLRRVRVMSDHRVELTGFTSGMVEALKARGLFGEIISWKMRLFVPVGEMGRSIFESVVDRWPLIDLTDRG